ncbi:MAG: hypothetical protein MMC23_000773 [Stictis urceolatum]|nr:hypothetical protein [Stictis urceolata]
MTDLSLSPNTHSVPSLDSTAPAATAIPFLPSALSNGLVEDEEDYTIKCICGYQEDDGSTILCETCQTWQHIECYYTSQGIRTPGDEENHYCHECEPRPLNSKSAAERQREKRDGIDLIDAKAKKPAASKGTRKKKASDHAANGWTADKPDGIQRNGTNGSPREIAPSSKRSKGSHRASNSVQTVPLKLPAAQSSRRSTSASHTLQSPSKNPSAHVHIEGEPYSVEFMHLYDNDSGNTSMQGNLIDGIGTADRLTLWSHDADAVIEATGGYTHKDIFFRCDQPVEEMDKPLVKQRTKVDSSREFHGRHPKWTYLTVETETPVDMVVGEIRGKIGQLKDYMHDEDSRWDYLRHPLPFVFFHPYLPIYIDARQEGTMFRYVRRSCTPSLKMKTFLENGSEMRFCFAANRDLIPGDELTLAWTPDEYIREFVKSLNRPEKYEMPVNVDEGYLQEYYSRVLADFGGCACEDLEKCSCIVRSIYPSDHKPVNGKSKKGRKGISSQSRSNGRTPSSRSGSEALRYHDDDDQDDDRSTSASSRSKPHSRDATPPEQSDREKRKFEALVEAIQHKEQEERKPKKLKNKRTSGGNVNNTKTPASASRATFAERSDTKAFSYEGVSASVLSTPAAHSKARYVDASTSRLGSNSPRTHSPGAQISVSKGLSSNLPLSNSPHTRPNYVDTATQVDMDHDSSKPISPTFQRRPVVSLTKRLLKRCHKERVELDRKREESIRSSSPSQSPIIADEPASVSPIASIGISERRDGDGDVMMGDETLKTSAPAAIAIDSVEDTVPVPQGGKQDEPISSGNSPIPKVESPEMPAPAIPSPTEEKSKDGKLKINGFRTAGLHVQLPSPPPLTTNSISTTAVSAIAQSPIIQTPTSVSQLPVFTPTSAAVLVQPSPIKKKLSLGDYMSRRSSNIHKIEPAASMSASGVIEKDQSPTTTPLADTLPKPLETFKEETMESGTDSANAITETPKADDIGDPMALDAPVTETT